MTLKNEKERLVKEVDNKASQLTSLESRALKMEAELKSFPVITQSIFLKIKVFVSY